MAVRDRKAEMDALNVNPSFITPKEEVSVEEDIRMPAAGELKEKFDDVMGVLSPEGNYSEAGLSTIGQAINQALQLFGPDAMPIDPLAIEEEGMLPVSIVKAIMMLNKAQQDAGLAQYIVDIEALTNDRALNEAAGKIMALAKNQTFKSFLAQLDNDFSGKQPEQAAPQPAPQQNSAVPQQMSEDELFMRRM